MLSIFSWTVDFGYLQYIFRNQFHEIAIFHPFYDWTYVFLCNATFIGQYVTIFSNAVIAVMLQRLWQSDSLFHFSCKADSEPDTTTVDSGYGSGLSSVCFQAFQFPDPAEAIYLRITYVLCDQNFANCVIVSSDFIHRVVREDNMEKYFQPTCARRKRRAVDSEGTLYTTTIGPFTAE